MEQATAPEVPRRWLFGTPGIGTLYATVTFVADALSYPQRLAQRPILQQTLGALREEAKVLDQAILRERIASSVVPESVQIGSVRRDGGPVSLLAPRLAQFFASLPMDDASVAEAFLASLELITCERHLKAMREGQTLDGLAPSAVTQRAGQALATCDHALSWLEYRDAAIQDACARHTEGLKLLRLHFGLS